MLKCDCPCNFFSFVLIKVSIAVVFVLGFAHNGVCWPFCYWSVLVWVQANQTTCAIFFFAITYTSVNETIKLESFTHVVLEESCDTIKGGWLKMVEDPGKCPVNKWKKSKVLTFCKRQSFLPPAFPILLLFLS